MKTPVVFLWEHPALVDNTPIPSQVFAFFPNLPEGHNNAFTSYAHVGQHSPCALEYARECKLARPDEYADLAKELESIGYDLKIRHSIP